MTLTGNRAYTLAAFAAVSAICAVPAAASTVEDFYKGKTINILVGFTTGNGADSYARLIARWYSKYVPGAPNVVVQNMPGSGSLAMTNFLYNVAPKDGLVFGIFNRNVPLEPLMGNANARFDPRKFTWIGSTNTEPSLCVAWHGSPVKSVADLQAREFAVAATGLNANSGLVPTVLNRVMGAKFKIIMGYPGSNEMSLAMERGEVEGRCGWSRSSLMATKPQWVGEKKINLLLQAGLQKSPLMPEVPLAMDSVKDEGDRQLLKVAVAWDEMAWPFAAPPDIPADRAKALREGFASVLKDPELAAQASREGLDLNYVPPAQIERILDDVFATPAPVIATLKEIVRPK
ncbi:MAG: Bug family tripartite tricarboxylate transporter substrate binding protein [Beijerinckiaceae bacterium]